MDSASPETSSRPGRSEFDHGLYDHLQSLLTLRRRARFTEVVAKRTRHLTVVLENLSQSHNFSAVLRSCDCFGVQDVYMLDHRQMFDVSKDVALGAEKWLTLHHYQNESAPRAGIDALKRRGYRVLVTSPHGESETLYEVPVDQPLAIVFGTELAGVSAKLESIADGRLHIPMYGFTESFNVSVAAALCLADLTRRLRESDVEWQLPETERRDLLFEWTRKSITHVEEIESRFYEGQLTE